MKDILNDFSDKDILKDYSLKRLIRYNTRMRLTDEDVSQHSYFVSLFCLRIMKELDLTIEEKYEILVKALLHDIGEIETSDIPYDIKLNNPQIKEILKSVEKDYYNNHWNEYKNILFNNNEKEEVILKLADTYSVKQYTLNEIIFENKNNEMIEIFESSKKRIENLKNKLFRILRRDKNE